MRQRTGTFSTVPSLRVILQRQVLLRLDVRVQADDVVSLRAVQLQSSAPSCLP